MNFIGTEGSLIRLEEGAHMTAAYRQARPTDSMCVFFGKEMLTELLTQHQAVGLRFYFAHNADGQLTLVTVATDGTGKDILDKVGNHGVRCPDSCCTDSPLGNALE